MIKPLKHLQKVNAYKFNNVNRRNKIRLDLNENSFGCSPKVIEALRKISIEDISFYPEYNELIDKIANKYDISSNNILITDGGDDAIRCVMQTYVAKNDKVVIPEPSFSMFEIQIALQQAKIIKITYNEDFSFPFSNFYKALDKDIKLVVIINPASPLGTEINNKELLMIIEKANKKDILVLVDETYHHFNNKTYISLIKEYDNLIILQSFSKAYGLAGIRLGFIASNEKNIKNISKVSLPYSVNSLAVIAGIEALKDDKHLQKVIKNINLEKEYLVNELNKLGFDVISTKTNFILVNCKNNYQNIYNGLQKKNILIKNFPNSKLLKNYIRISIGKHKENEALIIALKEILKYF